jgi:DNA mismatch repair protein MSH5
MLRTRSSGSPQSRCSHSTASCKHVSEVFLNMTHGIRFINSDTLQSLQIIQTESHPNSHSQGPNSYGAKEGLSVYGLFHHLARTPQGKQLLRQHFLRPTLSLNLINERLNLVGVFTRPDNASQIADIGKELRSIKNMRLVMLSLRKGVNFSKGSISRSVWSTILKVSQLSRPQEKLNSINKF